MTTSSSQLESGAETYGGNVMLLEHEPYHPAGESSLYTKFYEQRADDTYVADNLILCLGYMAEHNRRPLAFREDTLTVKGEPLQASYISLLRVLAGIGFARKHDIHDTPSAFDDLYDWYSRGYPRDNFHEQLLAAAEVKSDMLHLPSFVYPPRQIAGKSNPTRMSVDYVDSKIRWGSVDYLRAMFNHSYRHNLPLPEENFDSELLVDYTSKVKSWHHPPESEEMIDVKDVSRADFDFRQWFGRNILEIATRDHLAAASSAYNG